MKSLIVLCGGLSTRMGRDKGSMIFDNKPLIINVLESLKAVADEILLVLRDENQCKLYKKLLTDYKFIETPGFKLLTDMEKDQGPLGGILTGLKNIDTKMAMVVPCDSPFISNSFVTKMFEISKKYEGFDTFVPIWSDGNIEPLHSIYPRNSRKIIAELLKEDQKNVKTLIKRLNVKFVDIEELDISKNNFLNLNSPKDISMIDNRDF
jgi:molybdenum cofactor guanylyltransferase